MQNLLNDLKTLLENDQRLVIDGKLVKNKIIELALTFDKDLLKILLSSETIKRHFFTDVDGVLVFDKIKFVRFVSNKNFLPNSFTSFKNKIGLIREGDYNDDFITKRNDVVLAFPYKDCILQGGQTKEDDKRNELFWNETLAPDQIDRLLDPKCFTNWKLYNKDGVINLQGFENLEGLDNQNYIIKGNNLLVLHSLKKQFAGKVKLIYIDPPYNTGNDSFMYNDSFNHSTWLTFMKNRLTVARDLLRSDGLIWINLDDNEAHYCKVLCDDIFGFENFLADVIWQSRKSVSNDTHISLSTNHILLFAKNKININKATFKLPSDEGKYIYDDNDGKGKYKADPFDAPEIRANLSYPIENSFTKEIHYPAKGRHWRVQKSEFEKLLSENRICFGRNGKSKPQLKKYLIEEIAKGNTPTTLWNDIDTTTNATQQLENIFQKGFFKNPKPEQLIQRIVQLSTQETDLVLDFFSGSGTTAAVAMKMNRRFIAVEQMDYIETITVARIQKVIEGEQGGISKTVNWTGGGEFVYCELMKWNQTFIDRINAVEEPEKEKSNNLNIAAEPTVKYGDKATMELLKIFKEMQKYGFIDYLINKKLFEENLEDFKNMTLADQKKFLNEILDKNQLYISYSEIEDRTHKVSDADRRLNKAFYK